MMKLGGGQVAAQYNISLAEFEKNDFNIWDLSQQKEKNKAEK